MVLILNDFIGIFSHDLGLLLIVKYEKATEEKQLRKPRASSSRKAMSPANS